MKEDPLNIYKNPKGWLEFWLGLIVFIFLAGLFGRLHYTEINAPSEPIFEAKSSAE